MRRPSSFRSASSLALAALLASPTLAQTFPATNNEAGAPAQYARTSARPEAVTLARMLREAAERGRAGEAPREMQQAAQQAEQNQMSSAQQSQQRALDALEDVTDRLDEAGQDRDKELRRVLAELSAAIEALIERQQTEINRLEAARAARTFDGLDRTMIGISRDTAALAQDRAANDEALTGIARQLLDAAESQDASIVALRANPVDDAEALLRERESVERLRAALDEAMRSVW